MIRLVVTDIDGTLLPEGQRDLNPEYYDVMKELVNNGIVVVVASGRPSSSMKKVFGPVIDDIWFLSQNGCVIQKEDYMEVVTEVPLEWVKEFGKDLASYEKVDGVIETPTTAFVPYADSEMTRFIKEEYGMNISVMGGWDNIPEDEKFSMMVIYHPDGGDAFFEESGFDKKWRERLSLTVSGATWVDCLMPGNDKGKALRHLCKKLGIAMEDTIAFGDNMNDIAMLVAAGEGCAVDTAPEPVKEAADRIIPSYSQDGVLMELKKILEEVKTEK